MYVFKSIHIFVVIVIFTFIGCSDIANPEMESSNDKLAPTLSSAHSGQGGGALTANGWYEGEEIYYIHNGIEEGVTERGENDIYLIGGDRLHQANVVEFIPGESGYSPHWNVYVVHSAEGVTVQDILDSGYASTHYESEGVLFDDVEDLRAALQAGLVTFDRPGVVVNCPIISEKGAEAPGNTELSEEFQPFGETF
ncbi:hypothetical protein [Fodinibius sediminis]|uniref:Uncharacterized protein n=1 Tax=Fodinibius sediminis TaxID=1214077 RepID=A0A521E614_9BACT|nr:hypothetical protein [Fodinibius sediminis]SMO79383.1 hypothetical protein SAMN06265218_113145 [Fodinibius sediminis]